MKWNQIVLAAGAVAVLTVCANGAPAPPAVQLSPAQLQRVGQRIWQNEAGGKISGLTSWNSGEDFASLGIGHFIWYPKGQRGPFEESFPPLMAFLENHGVNVPSWTRGPCPWPNRNSFIADSQGGRQRELRDLLSKTVGLQTSFIIARLQQSLPKMLAAARPATKSRVRSHFEQLLRTPEGSFCLIDYVNFKGEGTLPTERYQGEGWGLLQVLEGVETGTPSAFAESAKRVLTKRVRNAPPARDEQRWLAGWHSRCDGYKRSL